VADTAIQWTDKTWNPTTGCTRVSPGCKNCYAFALHDMRHAAHKAGKAVPKQYAKPFTELQMFDDRLTDPLSWRKPCRVFVNSMSDLFHKNVPDEFIDHVFAVMALARRHTFQVLTKRSDRMRDYLTSRAKSAQFWKDAARSLGWSLEFEGISLVPFPLPNVWLGVSVEDQTRADERIPLMLQTPAAVRFLSCEPLLGPLEFSDVTKRSDAVQQLGKKALTGIHWLIVGGESGPGARTLNPSWVKDIVNQCRAAGVACFVKQLGSNVLDFAGVVRDKKGGDMNEWPAELRVREFPEPLNA
jgi:protein gp37